MIANGSIPFVDLVTPHLDLEEELVAVFRRAVKTGGFVGGSMVERFEHDFAQFSRVPHCVGVGSGTDALRFALMAASVQPGDTVLTVPNTFIATAEAISQAGARPDFVDIDERTYTMDPARLQDYLDTRCRPDQATGRLLNRTTHRPVTAIIPVHLYGQMADMDRILEIAERHRLIVIEDACQAHGADYLSHRHHGWRRAGAVGHAAAFSFYPGKNLGACGEAGAVTTNDRGLAERVRMLRDHGQASKYLHTIEGYNGRLDAIQAGLLSIKLKYLPQWNRERRGNAARYNELFTRQGASITVPYESPDARAVYHLYVIRVPNRDQVRADLAQAHIASHIHYPTPLHLQSAYEHLGYGAGDFPVAERVAREIVSLPMYPHLQLHHQQRVVDTVLASVSDHSLRSASA
jgi:dTDP-4-amino-4,6-dideoxygalactose transaminase